MVQSFESQVFNESGSSGSLGRFSHFKQLALVNFKIDTDISGKVGDQTFFPR